MVENLLHAILLNQIAILGGLLAPGDNRVRGELVEQIKHTKSVLDILEQKQGLKG